MPVLNVQVMNHRAIPVPGAGISARFGRPVPGGIRAVPAAIESGPAADPAVRALCAVHPVLGVLTEQERYALLRWAKIRAVNRREAIARRGDHANSIGLVLEGHLKSWTYLADGSEALLEILGPGDWAGEISVLQEEPREVNLTALSHCRLLQIDARQFRQVFDQQPEALCALLRLSTERLRGTTEQLLDSRSLSVRARLAKALLYLARISGSAVNGAAHLPFRLSQSEVGAMAGICREAVNRYLRTWRDSGWIEMSAGTLISVNATAISRVLRDQCVPLEI